MLWSPHQSTYCNVALLQIVKNIDNNFSKSCISDKQQFNIFQYNRIVKKTQYNLKSWHDSCLSKVKHCYFSVIQAETLGQPPMWEILIRMCGKGWDNSSVHFWPQNALYLAFS